MFAFRTTVAALAMSILAAPSFCQSIQINRDNKTIAISTTDEATAVADVAAITIGFETFGPDSKERMLKAGSFRMRSSMRCIGPV